MSAPECARDLKFLESFRYYISSTFDHFWSFANAKFLGIMSMQDERVPEQVVIELASNRSEVINKNRLDKCNVFFEQDNLIT